MPNISIIIPIYNIEKYIARCLDCILEQSYQDFEVLAVDDGSSDASYSICQEYAKRDSRIKAIHQDNGGASKARNTGLDHAKGRYITFIDGDDYLDVEFLEKLLRAMTEANADMSICAFECVDVEGNMVKSPFSNNYVPESVDQKTAAAYIGNNVPFGVVWNKMYVKELFETIRFAEGKTFEDEMILHHLYGAARKIVCVQEVLYYYVQRPGSKMTEAYTPSKMDIIEAYSDRIIFFVQNKYEDDVIIRTEKKLLEFFRIAYRNGRNTEMGKKKLQGLFENYKEHVYPILPNHTFEEKLFVHFPNITMQMKSVCRKIIGLIK